MCVNMVHECVILCVCCVYQWEVMGHQEVYGWSLRSSGPPTSTGQGPEHTWEAKATRRRTGTRSGNGAVAALEADRWQVVAEPIPRTLDSLWTLPSWGVRPGEGDFLCSPATSGSTWRARVRDSGRPCA